MSYGGQNSNISPDGFSTGLCNCCADCSTCCITCVCPWYAVARNKALADNRECSACDCCLAFPNIEFFTRLQLRARFNIPQHECADCLAMMYCPMCVICQDTRELVLRNKAAH